MFRLNDDHIKVNDEDIEYFNTNLQKVEDLDLLISQLESEKANDLLNGFSFLSNLKEESNSSSNDSLSNQLKSISENTNLLLNIEKSPFSTVINYCKQERTIYKKYEQIYDYKKKIESYQSLTINNIDDAIDYMNQIQSSNVDPFVQWDKMKDINPSQFCKSLKIANNYLINSKKTEYQNQYATCKDKVDLVEQKLEFFKAKILNCPFIREQPFKQFILFGGYLVDPFNEQLFTQYFKKFARDYLRSDPNRNSIKKQRHSKTINNLRRAISEKLEEYKDGDYWDEVRDNFERIINTICENLISFLVEKAPEAFKINEINFKILYNNFTGSTVGSLKHYEDNYLIEFTKEIIKSMDKDNIYDLLKYQKVIYEVRFKLTDTLSAKFEDIKNSIEGIKKILSKNHETKKFNQILKLSQTVIKYNTNLNYEFNDYKDEVLKYAELEAEQLMPFTDNFTQILSSKDPINQQIRDNFNNFLSNFTALGVCLSIEENERDYIYQFTHSFINCFYNKFKSYFLKAKDKEIAIECGLKFMLCLYSETKLFHYSKVEKGDKTYYDDFIPKIDKDEVDIFLNDKISRDAIEHNKNNEQIPCLKRKCYDDLLNIMDLCQ